MIYLYRVGEYDQQLLEKETRILRETQTEAEGRHKGLEHWLTTMSQVAGQMESIETCCQWASRNLESLDLEQKRLALEALDIRVVVDGKKTMIRDFLPVRSRSFFLAFPTPKAV